jgi:hypothetical protein
MGSSVLVAIVNYPTTGFTIDRLKSVADGIGASPSPRSVVIRERNS